MNILYETIMKIVLKMFENIFYIYIMILFFFNFSNELHKNIITFNKSHDFGQLLCKPKHII